MYKAEIIGKEFVRGMLSIAVRFTNEETNDEVKEKFETNQPQSEEWLGEQIDRKLGFLNELKVKADTIEIATKFEAKEKVVSEDKSAQTEFIDDVNKLRSMKRFIDLGIIPSESEAYSELLAKVKGNYKEEYLTLV